MLWSDYFYFILAIMACLAFSLMASGRVKSTFRKYDSRPCRSGLTGREVALRLLKREGASDISVGHVKGMLSDHYHPVKGVVNLSDSTYDRSSVAAVAVAAHEIGHVMQKKEGYALYRLRTALVPVVNFGRFLALPLVLVGLLLDVLAVMSDPNTGFYIAMVGVLLYGGSFFFALVTLPVEWNASKRAKEMLLVNGVLTGEELPAASEVLSAAALTYLASLLTSLVYFLRFLFYVLALFGRRSRR